jgi:hypothetical protein
MDKGATYKVAPITVDPVPATPPPVHGGEKMFQKREDLGPFASPKHRQHRGSLAASIFGGEKKMRLSTFDEADREALQPLDLGRDGTIDIEDLKAAAKMYGAAQAHKAIPFDAFPTAVHDTLKVFDTDGDNTIDPKELASAGQLYQEAKQAQTRMFRTTMIMGIVSILVLAAMLGVTILAVDVMKETNAGSDGMMTVAGTSTPVQVQEQQVNVPLGAIPLLAVDNPVKFLDQMKTLTIKVPEGGYQRSTITDARLQYNYRNQTVGAIIYTSHGHSMTIHPDPQNVTTEAHATLKGGRSFDVCAPCGDCGAISIVLTAAQKATLNEYLTRAAEKVNSGSSRACQLRPGAIAAIPSRGFQVLDTGVAPGTFPCDEDTLAANGVSTTYFGHGYFDDTPEDGVTTRVTVRFSVHDDMKQVSMEHTDQFGNIANRIIFNNHGKFFYEGGNLIACEDAQTFGPSTDLRGQGAESTATIAFLDPAENEDREVLKTFTIAEINDGDLEGSVHHMPTLEECGNRFRQNEHFATQAALETHAMPGTGGSDSRRAKILEQVPIKFRKEALRMDRYQQMIEHVVNTSKQQRRATTLATWQADLAQDAYTRCDGQNGNACVIRSGCHFAFRGSDDAHDWISNAAGLFSKTNVNGRTCHGGFVNEFNKLKSWLDSSSGGNVGSCSNPSWIGHSLGGAIAAVARLHYNKGTVYTYGQPQWLDDSSGCLFSGGHRVFHESDPVAGNLFGLMSTYWHAQSGTELRHYTDTVCTRRHWWGGCRSSYTTTSYATRNKDCDDHSGTWDTCFSPCHSMNNYEAGSP